MKTTSVSLSKTLLLVASALTLTICLPACQDDVVAPSPADIHYQSGGDTVILSPSTIPLSIRCRYGGRSPSL